MDSLAVIRRRRDQSCHHRAVAASIDRQLDVRRVIPVIARDVVDESVPVVIDSVKHLDRLRMKGSGQLGVKKRDAGIDDADQDALLGGIDGLSANVVDIDSGGADDVSHGLSGILKVPLLAEAGIDSLRLGAEIGAGGGHGRLGGEDLAQLIGRKRICRTIIETDPESRQAALKDQGVLGLDGGHLLGRDLLLVGDEHDPGLEDVRGHRDDVQQAEQSSQQEFLEGIIHIKKE